MLFLSAFADVTSNGLSQTQRGQGIAALTAQGGVAPCSERSERRLLLTQSSCQGSGLARAHDTWSLTMYRSAPFRSSRDSAVSGSGFVPPVLRFAPLAGAFGKILRALDYNCPKALLAGVAAFPAFSAPFPVSMRCTQLDGFGVAFRYHFQGFFPLYAL